MKSPDNTCFSLLGRPPGEEYEQQPGVLPTGQPLFDGSWLRVSAHPNLLQSCTY